MKYIVWDLESISFPQVKSLTEKPTVGMQKLLTCQANQNFITFHI